MRGSNKTASEGLRIKNKSSTFKSVFRGSSDALQSNIYEDFLALTRVKQETNSGWDLRHEIQKISFCQVQATEHRVLALLFACKIKLSLPWQLLASLSP